MSEGIKKLVGEIGRVAKEEKQKEEKEWKEKEDIINGIYLAIKEVRDDRVIEIKVENEKSRLRITKNSLSVGSGDNFSPLVSTDLEGDETDIEVAVKNQIRLNIVEKKGSVVRKLWLKAIEEIEKGAGKVQIRAV